MISKVTEFHAHFSETKDKILNSGSGDFKKYFALVNKAYTEGNE